MQVRYVNLKGEERKMTTRLDGVKQVYFQDPDGYWIEVNDNKF
jgi:lactoylglutathione lyase